MFISLIIFSILLFLIIYELYGFMRYGFFNFLKKIRSTLTLTLIFIWFAIFADYTLLSPYLWFNSDYREFRKVCSTKKNFYQQMTDKNSMEKIKKMQYDFINSYLTKTELNELKNSKLQESLSSHYIQTDLYGNKHYF